MSSVGSSVVVGSAAARWCPCCAREQLFEAPPCQDGHDEDCLDLACVVCGHAIVVGVLQGDAAVLLEVRAA